MYRSLQILVSRSALGLSAVVLAGCGQQGALYLPTEPAAAKRATLPETVLRSGVSSTPSQAPERPISVSPAAPATQTPSP